jgi:hypothetical protein
MTTAVSIWLVLILVASAAAKARRLDRAAAALQTYGIGGVRAQRGGLLAVIAVELGLAGVMVAGVSWAAGAVAGLFLAFTVVTAVALLAGRGGRPCACFGSASRLGWSSPARAAALAALAGVLAQGWLPAAPSQYDRWLTVGLAVSLVAVVALGLAVLALAREVGVLRLGTSTSGRGALEIPEEGPQLGVAQGWAAMVPAYTGALLRLAIFTSEGCPLCRQVEPAVRHVAADPLLAVRIFDEVQDAAIWGQAASPGSPYAVALDLEGVALAKGTFNSLSQLESILGTARDREQGLAIVA